MFENKVHQKRERKAVEKQATKEKGKKSRWKQIRKEKPTITCWKKTQSKANGNRLKQYKETRSGVRITSSGICNAIRRYRRFGITRFLHIPPVLQDTISSTIPATSYYQRIIDRTVKEYNAKFTPNILKLLLFYVTLIIRTITAIVYV